MNKDRNLKIFKIVTAIIIYVFFDGDGYEIDRFTAILSY